MEIVIVYVKLALVVLIIVLHVKILIDKVLHVHV